MTDEAQESAQAAPPGEADPDVQALRARFGGAVGAARAHRGQVAVELASAALLEAARFLRDERGFKLLSYVAGVDCLELPSAHRFKGAYSLLDLGRAKRLRLEVPCEDDLEPRLPSVASVWPAAACHESEAYDLVGIVFEGHPGLERILTPEGFEGHPHRKDFDVSAEAVEFTFRPTPEGKREAKE
ncbi:MAG: NADH-quinone oxidoreductase subunit C [Candidatus Tectomicrobia bacterium]|uniref:NADH-quinone oxidoreductase subunit C n=1 Tax=Tectimicrobiota bacterium TaxID=2528274 RepID=A0A932ZSG3_UNCTE|nr:NADH-quinone oxidoreductase subunit C [Candidatus Tectomicrobia bacterium]